MFCCATARAPVSCLMSCWHDDVADDYAGDNQSLRVEQLLLHSLLLHHLCVIPPGMPDAIYAQVPRP